MADSAQDWIIRVDEDGVIHRLKRISPAQLRFIDQLESQLGYIPKNHGNMPAYKASKRIQRLLELTKQQKLL